MDMFPEVATRQPAEPGGFNPVAGCEACEKNVMLRQGLTPVYGYQFWEPESGPPFGVHFDVIKAQTILRWRMLELLHGHNPGGFERLDPDQIAIWIEHALDVNEEHALYHISEEAAHTPGIMLPFTMEVVPAGLRAVAHVSPCSILMDGNHRALRHLRLNKPMSIYVMRLEEMQSCFAGFEIGNLLKL